MSKLIPKSLKRKAIEKYFSSAVNLMRREYAPFQSRTWSNSELRKFATHFKGDIINVSGWQDMDKEGGYYRDYFTNKSSYVISNKGGTRGQTTEGQLYLDLETMLPSSLRQRFDVVFNHTTLEHIYNVELAVRNLCVLSRDILVVVVPFMQVEHWEACSYFDYWRFTEFTLNQLMHNNGFQILYLSSNHNPVYPIYFFVIASRRPEIWKGKFPGYDNKALFKMHTKFRNVDPVVSIMI